MSQRPWIALVACVSLVVGCGGDGDGGQDAGPPPVDQCTNAADIAVIENVVQAADAGVLDGGVPDGGDYPTHYARLLGYVVQDCTNNTCLTNILQENMVYECISACLATTPAVGLSEGCVGCQVEVVQCAIDHCFVVCQGSDMSLCEQCAIDYCAPRLVECSGLPGDIP